MANSHRMMDTEVYKYTPTHIQTGCGILVVFPLQQWLYGRAVMLRYTYIALLKFKIV